MPMREYTCRVCQHTWEEYRKDQTDPNRCVICKCDTVNRKISAGSFSFAHGGFKNGYTNRSSNG